jgi:DNA-binding XRE family transcriptional regulator
MRKNADDLTLLTMSDRRGRRYALVPVDVLLELVDAANRSSARRKPAAMMMPEDLRDWAPKFDTAAMERFRISLIESADELAGHSSRESGMSEDIAAFDHAKAESGETFPEEIAVRLIGGEHPVKVFREYRGLTQQALADAAGTTAAYVSQIETGVRVGGRKTLAKFAEVLGVERADLEV